MESTNKKLISVIAPAYNEEEVLPEFHKRLTSVFANLPYYLEVIYVNDGSKDKTLATIKTLRNSDDRITIVDLSRNFGKEIAMTAGMDYASGDAIIVIDTDLQDPPELIPELINVWNQGYEVVYARRLSRDGETWLKKSTASLFYRLIKRISRIEIPHDTGDFRLLSRRAVNALNKLREQHRFMKGLFAWIGYPQKAVPYHRDKRFAGETKWGYWKLWNFAIEGITSFTIVPLKIATYIGLTVAILAFAYALIVIYRTLYYGEAVQGYPSLMVVMLLLGGIQLASLGIIGEYLGRMFNETKNRPLYLIQELRPSISAITRSKNIENNESYGTQLLS